MFGFVSNYLPTKSLHAYRGNPNDLPGECSAMPRVVEVNNQEDLAALRLIWHDLWLRTPGASFFQSFDWLEIYWQHFGQGQRMRVLVVYCCGELQGILPLVIRTEQTSVGTLATITYPLHDWGSFYGPIGPNPTVTLLAGFQHLGNTPRDWDIIDPRWIEKQGDLRRVQTAMEIAGMPGSQGVWKTTHLIDLEHSWSDYWLSRRAKLRENVRRMKRRLATRGKVSLIRYRPSGSSEGEGDPRWDLLHECERLGRLSWQGDSQSGTTISHESIRPFLRDSHAAAARLGCLDLNLLSVGGQPVAFNYNYRWGSKVCGLRMGYDPAYPGAGSVAMAEMIENSCQLGDTEIDLGPEYEDAKKNWTNKLAPMFRCSHFPSMFSRAQIIRVGRWVRNRRDKMRG